MSLHSDGGVRVLAPPHMIGEGTMNRKWMALLLMTALTLLGTVRIADAAIQGDPGDAMVIFGVT